MNRLPGTIAILSIFIAYISIRVFEFTLPLVAILFAYFITHALLGLPQRISKHVFAGLGLKDNVQTRHKLAALVFMSTILLSVELGWINANLSLSGVIQPAMYSLCIMLFLFINQQAKARVSSYLGSYETTTLIAPRTITSPNKSLFKMMYFSEAALVTASITLSLGTIAGASIYVVESVFLAALLFVVITTVWVITSVGNEFKQGVASQKLKYREAVRIKIDTMKPTAVLYHSGRFTKSLTDAISVLKKSNEKFIVIVRNKATYLALKKAKVSNIVLCIRLNEIEPLLPDSVSKFYYTNINCKNVHVIRYYEKQHILINSPIDLAGKSPAYSMFTHRIMKSSEGTFFVETVEGDVSEFEDKISAINSITPNTSELVSHEMYEL